MRRDKVEQANVFVGMMNVIDKDKFMEEQIESLTELEKVQLVNRILGNMGANQLFEPEGQEPIHPGVLEAAYSLLNDWMKQDNDILRIEYDGFVTDNENKKENENETTKETTKSGWENGKSFEGLKDKKQDKWKVNNKRSAEGWTMVKSKKKKNINKENDKKDIEEASDNEKNYYQTLSEDEKEKEDKNDKHEEKLKENKETIAYMTKKDFSQRKKKKKKDRMKTDIQTQWTEIKQKMDLLVRKM